MAKWDRDGLLRELNDSGASDLLITVGTPPQLRVHGMLEPVGSDALHAEQTA